MSKMHTLMLNKEWPLQRLVVMLNQLQTKEKDDWKQCPLLHSTDKDIGPLERDEVVSWIAKLTIQFSFLPETFFLACSILDRFITSIKAQPKYLKCIAISCFYLASKICEEEDVVPFTGELVNASECGCRVRDVLRMEKIILEKLSWNLNCATSLDYLHVFHAMSFGHFTDLSSRLSSAHQRHVLTSCLMNALCYFDIAKFPNDVISLSVLSLHLESLSRDFEKWACISSKLQSLGKIKTKDFMMCREVIKAASLYESEDQILLKSAFFTMIVNEDARLTKETNSNVAMKRKASTPSPTIICDRSKKSHPDLYFDHQHAMEYNESRDSETTMSASEDETEEFSIAAGIQSNAETRPLTYAEIVKSNLNSESLSDRKDDISPVSGSSSCSLQASYGFLCPTVSVNSQLTGVPT